ncbi:MAG TPA: hybrid sensor histidine kinase/response regulator, partial [Nitrospira sp.]|nr:hybrid sensor histidine kinase/response regulator [Nitrospira sp.]
LGQAHVSACAERAGELGQAHVSACAGRAGENEHEPDIPLHVWADRDRLVQIVINLVQNAMKFTPEEGRITVTVGKENHRHAGVTVRDTGPGIPTECLEKVFDPFFRVAATRTAAKGLGLGLSIVRALVELHGGTIEARRPEDGGAEFHFTLPLRVSAEPAGAARGYGRILVVDDDKDIRELLEDRLRAMGYAVETETDGLRALKAALAGRFSGMILDIGIPSLDGMDVLKQIRQTDEQLPIIMVTASGAKDTAIKAIGFGAQAYLLKPFDVEELDQVIASCFRT